MEYFSSKFTQIFNSTRLYAEPMLPLCRLKVKFTLESQNWNVLIFLTCTWIYLKLAQIFALNLKDICCITSTTCRSTFITVMHFEKVMPLFKYFNLLTINTRPCKEFLQTWLKCSPQVGNVQNLSYHVPALSRTLVGLWIAFSDSSSFMCHLLNQINTYNMSSKWCTWLQTWRYTAYRQYALLLLCIPMQSMTLVTFILEPDRADNPKVFISHIKVALHV